MKQPSVAQLIYEQTSDGHPYIGRDRLHDLYRATHAHMWDYNRSQERVRRDLARLEKLGICRRTKTDYRQLIEVNREALRTYVTGKWAWATPDEPDPK